MPAWSSYVWPFIAPIALALATAAVTSALLTPRRLRRELAEDTGILGGVAGTARGLLATDIRNRAIALSGWNRFPALIGEDLVRMAILILLAAGAAFQTWTYVDEPVDAYYFDRDIVPVMIIVTLSTHQFFTVFRGVFWRAVDRRAFLLERAVPIPGDRIFVRSASEITSAALGFLATVLPSSISLGVLAHQLDSRAWGVVVVFSTMLAFVAILGGVRWATEHRPPSFEERVASMREHERRLAEEMAERKRRGEQRRQQGSSWWSPGRLFGHNQPTEAEMADGQAQSSRAEEPAVGNSGSGRRNGMRPSGMDEDAIRGWWDSLSDEERARFDAVLDGFQKRVAEAKLDQLVKAASAEDPLLRMAARQVLDDQGLSLVLPDVEIVVPED